MHGLSTAWPTYNADADLCQKSIGYHLNSVYLSHLLFSKGVQSRFEQLDRSGVKSALNFDDIRGLKIIVPPISLQNRFAEACETVLVGLKPKITEALDQSLQLGESLSHQFFVS